MSGKIDVLLKILDKLLEEEDLEEEEGEDSNPFNDPLAGIERFDQVKAFNDFTNNRGV